MLNSHLIKKFVLEIFILVIGISLSFWLNNLQTERSNRIKEKQLIHNILLNLAEIKSHSQQRLSVFEEENHLMDYLAISWNSINKDSIADVFLNGDYRQSFHNLFLDYREFHPPIADIESIIADGSISLIKNKAIKVALITLTDSSLDFVLQNVKSEIELQQAFRVELLTNKLPILNDALQTSQLEMYERFEMADTRYKSKIKLELDAILTMPEAYNYINLKIRQRYFVMLFLKSFMNDVDKTIELIKTDFGHLDNL